MICQVTSLVWGTLDEQIVTGHDNGDIVQWDVKTHQKVKIVSDHAKSISDMQLSADSKINTWIARLGPALTHRLRAYRDNVHLRLERHICQAVRHRLPGVPQDLLD